MTTIMTAATVHRHDFRRRTGLARRGARVSEIAMNPTFIIGGMALVVFALATLFE